MPPASTDPARHPSNPPSLALASPHPSRHVARAGRRKRRASPNHQIEKGTSTMAERTNTTKPIRPAVRATVRQKKRSSISQALIEAQKAFDKASRALPEYAALQKARGAHERR